MQANQITLDEEDISWDEIDGKRGDAGGSESKIDLWKRMSAVTADEDEDLKVSTS